MIVKWTKPFFGVEHLISAPEHLRISMTTLMNGVAVAHVLLKNSSRPFTSAKETTGSPDAVRRTAESWAIEFQ